MREGKINCCIYSVKLIKQTSELSKDKEPVCQTMCLLQDSLVGLLLTIHHVRITRTGYSAFILLKWVDIIPFAMFLWWSSQFTTHLLSPDTEYPILRSQSGILFVGKCAPMSAQSIVFG